MINSMATHGSFHENNFDPRDRVAELEKEVERLRTSIKGALMLIPKHQSAAIAELRDALGETK